VESGISRAKTKSFPYYIEAYISTFGSNTKNNKPEVPKEMFVSPKKGGWKWRKK